MTGKGRKSIISHLLDEKRARGLFAVRLSRPGNKEALFAQPASFHPD
jgi:hypothetical protein